MLRSSLILAVLGFSASHPIQDVISLIGELKVTAKKDQEQDDIQYENDTHEYTVSKEELEGSISSEKAAQEDATALKEAKANEADALGDEIAELTKRLAGNKDNESSIGSARDKENGVFIETETTLKDTVTALEACLEELSKGTGLMAISQERMKVMAQAYLPASEQHVVSTFLAKQQLPEDPKARVYDSKTGSVKDLFVKLIRKFKDKLTDKQKQETRAINAHALSLAALNNEHTSLSALKSEKESRKGEAEGVRDQAKSDAASAKTAFDEFTKSLSDKEREYRDTTSNYNLVTKERQEEGKAMDIAVDVLKSISGVRADHEELPAATAAAFLQLAGLTPKDKVVQLLRTAGGKLHSAQLQKLAMEIGATKGPFNQINNMIQKMVDRLVTEQQKEDNHKAWCDNELEVTNAGHDDKDAKLQKIEADIDTATGKETSNKEDKADARKQISEGQKRKAGETEERRLQKNNNKVTIDDAKKAQKGLQQALTVLREWNEKRDTSVDPTAQNNKVFTLLEDAEVHYAKLEADIESADTQQETDFRQSMADIKKLVATLEAQVEGHNNTLHRLSSKLSSLGKKKKHTKDALFELNQYLDDLKPACVGEEGAYEKRKENRKKEKDALKEAKQILADAFKNMAKPELVSVKKHVYTQ